MGASATVSLIVFVAASMVGIGLQVTTGAMREALRLRGFLGRALVANFLVIPLMGVALVRLVPMKPELAVALLLLACAPGGPSALQFTGKQKAALAHAGTTAFALSLVAVFLSPFLMELALSGSMPLAVPYARAFWVFLLLLVLPLGLGLLLRSQVPGLATRLAPPAVITGTLAFVAFIGFTLARRQANMAALEPWALLAMFGFILASLAIGWLLGGPEAPTRRVLATASSMRNVPFCLAVAQHSPPGINIEVPLVAFSALMIPPNLVFFLVTLLKGRRGEGQAS
ncbi:bile acid:sodium symporter family protein [Thiohalorhabdus methylotrophus]|uniref:Bile acid:sodium symporter family protein n=1 Tax=Thiohalorhabdus methylotrophus TaxID=3242694 RepID=A0ABV4TVQ4_9GAMM